VNLQRFEESALRRINASRMRLSGSRLWPMPSHSRHRHPSMATPTGTEAASRIDRFNASLHLAVSGGDQQVATGQGETAPGHAVDHLVAKAALVRLQAFIRRGMAARQISPRKELT
jgi:hypothetical protein